MGYFKVRYDSRVVNYYRRGFIRLATGSDHLKALTLLGETGAHSLKEISSIKLCYAEFDLSFAEKFE